METPIYPIFPRTRTGDVPNPKWRLTFGWNPKPRLKEGIAQAPAGRTALLTLLPFSIEELASAGIRPARDELLRTGFLPAIYDRNQPPAAAWEAYCRTYVERDVPDLVRLVHREEFEVFLRLLAGRVGGLSTSTRCPAKWGSARRPSSNGWRS